MLMFWNTLSVPSHRGHVNQKNNWDQYDRVFIQVKVWLKRSLGQLEGGRMGRGCVQVQGQAVEGKDPSEGL
jgi:hypothetical protein